MDENYRVDFAFLEDDESILAVLLFGSGANNQLTDVIGKRYDVWLFEELALYMKIQVIENHKVVFCKDLPELYEYFYFYRKIWNDQKHRNELDKEELMKILEKL
ncbi:MAG TPA: DNA polymerase subunit beta [Methanosarcinales archaeon]|nr:DNA polymerase subunit beta [Methanosarcinales archaeon]